MRAPNPSLRITQINVAPLIDVLLVLLIIFMTLCPAPSPGLNGRIPRTARSGASPEQPIVVVFARDRTIRIQSEVVSRTELAIRLPDILKPRMDRTVFLEADSEIAFEAVAEVMDIIHNAGAESLGLITQTQIHGSALSSDR